jgi:hypothetical protein
LTCCSCRACDGDGVAIATARTLSTFSKIIISCIWTITPSTCITNHASSGRTIAGNICILRIPTKSYTNLTYKETIKNY